MEEDVLGSLGSDEKKWLAIAIGGIIVADGSVDESELLYLQSALAFLDNKQSINDLILMVKERRLPQLRPIQVKGVTAYHMLKFLGDIAAADSSFSKSEAEFLKFLGGRLGLDTSFTMSVLSLVKKMAEVKKEETRLAYLATKIID